MSPVPTSRPVPSAPVRLVVPISAVFVLALAAGGCSDDGESSAPSTTAPTTTSPFEVVITEDQIAVGLQEGVFGPGGELLVTYTPDEQAVHSIVPIHSLARTSCHPAPSPIPTTSRSSPRS